MEFSRRSDSARRKNIWHCRIVLWHCWVCKKLLSGTMFTDGDWGCHWTCQILYVSLSSHILNKTMDPHSRSCQCRMNLICNYRMLKDLRTVNPVGPAADSIWILHVVTSNDECTITLMSNDCVIVTMVTQGWGEYWTCEYEYWKISTQVVLEYNVFSIFMFIIWGKTITRVVLAPALPWCHIVERNFNVPCRQCENFQTFTGPAG